MAQEEYNVPIYNGTSVGVSGSTPFGYYDAEAVFQAEAPKIVTWCALKLGYPIIDIELQDINFYACIEEAVSEYSSHINNFLMQQHMIDLVGMSQNTNLDSRAVQGGLQKVITIANNYADEAFVGGNMKYYSGSISIVPNQQVYDLDVLFPSASASGGLEIKRIYHQEPPAISRYFDPYAGTGVGSQYILGEFGWGAYSPGINFVMMPIYEDLLRLQAIEFNTKIRRSSYSFDVHDNKLRIFPWPSKYYTVWIEYIMKNDRELTQLSASGSLVMTSPSDIPYTRHSYTSINHTGRQWIKEFALALVKELLGTIRSKYQSIPAPNGEVSLDGEILRNEGIARKTELIEQLKADFEKMSKTNQWEQKKLENEVANELLQRIPLKIYIG